MNVCFKNLTFVLVLLLSMILTGEALKCHVCNSLEDDACEVLKDDRYVVECQSVNNDTSRNHTICRYEILSVTSKHRNEDSSRTKRSCGYTKHPKFDCFYNSNRDLKETICECEEDGCNGSNTLQLAMQILLSCLLFSYFTTSLMR
ncbi:UPAR/Ly6 domain-containing protein CG9338 isoform X2 [Parasteatoda tepidariorum]|uniref:UPAR/Ly6 domain-containing protein CG9338 isoform X2 n=1 Tax=Parasteatoda tepidariorum TaxID=114398 RepID=UPI001C71F3B1|nr:uncharacterized protein LOC107447215 isoform X2 [Parasteatoda tepidariorum]